MTFIASERSSFLGLLSLAESLLLVLPHLLLMPLPSQGTWQAGAPPLHASSSSVPGVVAAAQSLGGRLRPVHSVPELACFGGGR